ncbi:MAG: ParA family protein [Candidatus Aminicenantaceae bacterium]
MILKKIAIATSKGGVGKTVTAINLGAGLAQEGKRVLIVDCDPQGNVGGHFNISSEHTLSDLLSAGHRDVIIEIRENLDIIASGRKELYNAQRELTKDDFGIFKFEERISFIQEYDYDFVFCDFSPSDTLINRAALIFCNQLLIPINPGIDAIMGAERYIELAQEISSKGKKTIDIFGILINLYERNTVISKEIDIVARERWGAKVFKTKIRKNVSIGEARINNQTIFEYSPRSNGAKDFKALTAEVLNVSKEA